MVRAGAVKCSEFNGLTKNGIPESISPKTKPEITNAKFFSPLIDRCLVLFTL
jgi:hypothetical protein